MHTIMLSLLLGCATSKDNAPAPEEPSAQPSPEPQDTSSDEHPEWSNGDSTVAPYGELQCEVFQHPCNHQIRIAVRVEGANWQQVSLPVAVHASVPDAVIEPFEHNGMTWSGLWITYVESNPNNLPDPEQPNLSVAFTQYPQNLTATELQSHFTDPQNWRHYRTNSHEMGTRLVDADRELVLTENGVEHAVFTITLRPEIDGSFELHRLSSMNGVDFDGITTIPMDGENGSDPDCFPSQPQSAYPGPISTDQPWTCYISRGAEILRFSGDWNGLSQTSARHYGISVTETSWVNARQMTVGSFAEPEDLHAPTDALLFEFTNSTPTSESVLMAWSDHSETALGIYSPNWLHLESGAELLVYHTPILSIENFEPDPSE